MSQHSNPPPIIKFLVPILACVGAIICCERPQCGTLPTVYSSKEILSSGNRSEQWSSFTFYVLQNFTAPKLQSLHQFLYVHPVSTLLLVIFDGACDRRGPFIGWSIIDGTRKQYGCSFILESSAILEKVPAFRFPVCSHGGAFIRPVFTVIGYCFFIFSMALLFGNINAGYIFLLWLLLILVDISVWIVAGLRCVTLLTLNVVGVQFAGAIFGFWIFFWC